MSEMETLISQVEELKALVRSSLAQAEEARCRRDGLLGYEGLRERLAIDGKMPALRTVRKIVSKHRGIIRPVSLGHKMVGFRLPRVEMLLAHLAGDPQVGGRQV